MIFFKLTPVKGRPDVGWLSPSRQEKLFLAIFSAEEEKSCFPTPTSRFQNVQFLERKKTHKKKRNVVLLLQKFAKPSHINKNWFCLL